MDTYENMLMKYNQLLDKLSENIHLLPEEEEFMEAIGLACLATDSADKVAQDLLDINFSNNLIDKNTETETIEDTAISYAENLDSLCVAASTSCKDDLLAEVIESADKNREQQCVIHNYSGTNREIPLWEIFPQEDFVQVKYNADYTIYLTYKDKVEKLCIRRFNSPPIPFADLEDVDISINGNEIHIEIR